MPARIVALGLLLGLAACDNRDDEVQDEVRRLCNEIQLGTTTLRQASASIGDVPVFITGGCRSDLEPIPDQTCEAGASVCQFRWQFLSNDCGPGGCTFACDVRTLDVANGTPPSFDTPICARRFLRQQPFVFQ
jgi:hypothetical protein